MARPSAPWWNQERKTWCSVVGGRRRTLCKGKSLELSDGKFTGDDKSNKVAVRKLAELLKERELLSKVGGEISVAALCEKFLIDANERLKPSTFKSYQYSCQKLVDCFGARAAHSMQREDMPLQSECIASLTSGFITSRVGNFRWRSLRASTLASAANMTPRN